MKIARTIADLGEVQKANGNNSIAEVIQYRNLDGEGWLSISFKTCALELKRNLVLN